MNKRSSGTGAKPKKIDLEMMRELVDRTAVGRNQRIKSMNALKIGRLLKTARLESKLTQRQVASLLHITQPQVAKLEAGIGARGPTIATIKKFVEICGMRLVIAFLKDDESVSAQELVLLEYRRCVLEKSY